MHFLFCGFCLYIVFIFLDLVPAHHEPIVIKPDLSLVNSQTTVQSIKREFSPLVLPSHVTGTISVSTPTSAFITPCLAQTLPQTVSQTSAQVIGHVVPSETYPQQVDQHAGSGTRTTSLGSTIDLLNLLHSGTKTADVIANMMMLGEDGTKQFQGLIPNHLLNTALNVSEPSNSTMLPNNNHMGVLSELLGSVGPKIADILGSISFAPSEANREKVYRSLNSQENNAILELQQIYDLSFTVDLEPLIHIKQLDPSLNQLVNQSSITVLRLIKFAKRLEAFSALSQHCQIGILKGVWLNHLLLRSVSLYDTERDVWVTPRGDIPTEILKNATGYVKLHDDHVNYCKSFKAIIGDDLTIVILLLLTLLFSPDGPYVMDHQLVSDIQDKYLTLLKHYLEGKYSFSKANTMFGQLMSKLMELKQLAVNHGKYLLDLNPNDIEPIMLEILDLK